MVLAAGPAERPCTWRCGRSSNTPARPSRTTIWQSSLSSIVVTILNRAHGPLIQNIWELRFGKHTRSTSKKSSEYPSVWKLVVRFFSRETRNLILIIIIKTMRKKTQTQTEILVDCSYYLVTDWSNWRRWRRRGREREKSDLTTILKYILCVKKKKSS